MARLWEQKIEKHEIRKIWLWRLQTESWWGLDERRDLVGTWCCKKSERYGGRPVCKALKVKVASLNIPFSYVIYYSHYMKHESWPCRYSRAGCSHAGIRLTTDNESFACQLLTTLNVLRTSFTSVFTTLHCVCFKRSCDQTDAVLFIHSFVLYLYQEKPLH